MTAAAGPALVWCPFPDGESAAGAARALLDERLIACANILPPMQSIFDWHGARAEATEVAVLMKTDAALLNAVIDRLGALHPYDEPAILGWRCDAASAGTVTWLGALPG